MLRSDQDGTPSVVGGPASTTSPPGAAVADRFVPPTVRDGPEQVMPVTLLDGRRFELRYPPGLDLAGLGVLPVGGIDWPVRSEPFRCCGSQLRVRYTTIEEVYGDAEPITTYPGADGRRVPYYQGSDAGRAAPFDYLVFEFGPWLVEVPNIQRPADFEDRKTEEELATWARSLQGHLDPDGYLVLDPAPPLTLGPLSGELAVIGGPAIPGGRAIGLPHVELISPEAVCAPDATKENSLEPFEFETDDEVGAGWCDAEAGVRISVSGPQNFVDRAVSGLEVDRAGRVIENGCPALNPLPPGDDARASAIAAAERDAQAQSLTIDVLDAYPAERPAPTEHEFAATPFSQCNDELVAGRTWVVEVNIPGFEPSESLSKVQYFVARFDDGWKVWGTY